MESDKVELNFRGKLKEQLMPTHGQCVGSVNILIAAPIN